ncbi:hypothetical protein HJG60_012140 [Phyllostomus discolor]|uniref:Uncharacterized protein n=1 Tax=Phyllostomus discolor TaxID=89673 RepID=A0A833ZM13_9CHIR|nr:hypothetical protein HJG60_012140 [Phyllostomus discolor]
MCCNLKGPSVRLPLADRTPPTRLQSSAQGPPPLGSCLGSLSLLHRGPVVHVPCGCHARREQLCHCVLPYFGVTSLWVCFLCWAREHPSPVPTLQQHVGCRACKSEFVVQLLSPLARDPREGRGPRMRSS